MLSQRAKKLKPSPTLALAAKAKALIAEGKDVISLSVGEPDWNTYANIIETAKQALDDGKTKYTPAGGIPELKKAILDQTNGDLSTDYTTNEVTISAGGKFVLYGAFQVLLDKADEVIIPAPFWVSYPTMVDLAEGQPVIVVCDEKTNFKLSAEMLEKAITSKTKALVLNSPSNPTGFMYTEEELKDIAEVLLKHPNIILISDDIYNRLVFDQDLAPHILNVCPELRDRTLIVNGASKTYSMTGWRLGWTIGPEEIIAAMTKLQSQSVSCAAPFTQEATITAITNTSNLLKDSVNELKERRDFAVSAFNDLPGISVIPPQGAFYLWVNVSEHLGRSFNAAKLESTREFAQALLEDQMVAAVPGIDFGLDGYLRVSYAIQQEKMKQALERFNSFIGKLS